MRDNVIAIFAISDNEAYNHLYEFLGRDYINTKLKEKGLHPLQISHRLESENAESPNTKPTIFRTSDSMNYMQSSILGSQTEPIKLNRLQKGKGFCKNDTLANAPMDFSKKNYLPISTLHDMMKRVQFPKAFELKNQFILNDKDQEFLLDIIKIVPRTVGYYQDEYYDD
ncbi:MAG: serine hydrolase [Psychroserpens sp.]|uniref:serine hydrolase n=1 Tax=Psychroserpens sp. TaxID=2020870 RepID=UPI0030028B81